MNEQLKPAALNSSAKSFVPGIHNTIAGRERYCIRGGAMVVVGLNAGDKIELVDPEGLQCAHAVAFDAKGRSCSGQFTPAQMTEATQLLSMLQQGSSGAQKISDKLKRFGMDLAAAPAAILLDGQTRAGNSVERQLDTTCIGIFGAPGEPMSAHCQNPPTDLILWVTRGTDADDVVESAPDPMAEPLQDFTVKAASARSFEVSAGQFIQILDISGRQCSDFQCFDTRALDQGIERNLDATATRTMVGSAYPRPGLYSKFFDTNLEPVIEVVQDTCGRHDSFGLACTSKYYDELGYPGHINCSDNFNFALQDYPILPRKGWMAINLFFNTFFDDSFQLYMDEPWSRPGDYILMRASRDLVCVSSSCSDDIDAANGWIPTDIQVRVYESKELFKRAFAVRKTVDEEPVMTQETGFHPETSKLTRDFVDYQGFWLANTYTNLGEIAEYWACRESAVMIDLSPLRKYEVTGPDAEQLMQTCVTRDIKKLSVGQVTYTAMCNVSGGMIDDGTVFRLGQNNFRWVGGSDDSGLWLRKQAEERNLKAWVKSSTDQLANMQIQGPDSRTILQEVVWTRPDQASIEELGWFRFSIARINHADGIPIVVSRTGYTGELGYEIFCHPRDAAEMWRVINNAGSATNLKPMGLGALDLLRVEAGLIFAGYEFCDQTDPFEAGIPFTVPLESKPDDFIGRDALLKRKANPQRRLVGLDVEGREAVEHGDCVFSGKHKIGEITSACMSPILGKSIALCRMNIEFVDAGTTVEIGKLDQHQKRIPAVVVPFPHFDPGKQRVRGNYTS